jgi:Zn-dependent protease with chaperone function
MFALRGIAVSLSVFMTVYCVLSFSVSLTWRKVRTLSQRQPVGRVAGVLLVLRMFPLAASTLITVVLAVPSFLLLEPRTIVEPIGGLSLTLGICGLAVVTFGLGNVSLAICRASRTIYEWMDGAQPIHVPAPLPVLRIPRAIPPMTAVGIIRPRILFSSAAEFLLNANEFQAAVNHEIAHVNRHDNLKKLLLRFVRFPGMRELDEAWLEATEVAADDAAVSSIGEALDLAAALIKLCRACPMESPTELSMSLVHSPVSLVNQRVERLIHWSVRAYPEPGYARRYAWGFGLGVLVAVALSYGQLLMAVHDATEWLVR